MLALNDPNCELVGISCVAGNCALEKVLVNVARVLTLCGREDIPFYRGCSGPIVNDFVESDYHGKDGLGDAPNAIPTTKDVHLQPSPGNALDALIAASKAHENELVVACVAPLTNIALAEKLDPDFPKRLKQVVVMGGAEAIGNATPTTEFNFYFDPEAAYLVLRRFRNITLVTWECTERHSLSWDWLAQWMSKDTVKGRFMAAIMANIIIADKRRHFELGWQACDPMAVAIALRPDLVTSVKPLFADVERSGLLSRGQSVFDWGSLLGKDPNVMLITSLSLKTFKEMMDVITD